MTGRHMHHDHSKAFLVAKLASAMRREGGLLLNLRAKDMQRARYKRKGGH